MPWDCLNNQIFVYTFTPPHAPTPEVQDQSLPFRDAIQQPTQDRQFQREHASRLDHSVRSDRPFRTDRPVRDSGQQPAGERSPLASRFGPPPRPTTSNNVTHDASGYEICRRYKHREVHSLRLPVCPLVLDTWLPRVTPGQRVSKAPQMSSAELTHPYDTLNLSASPQDIQTKLGSPSCLQQLK